MNPLALRQNARVRQATGVQRKGDLVKLSSMSLSLIKDIVRAREV